MYRQLAGLLACLLVFRSLKAFWFLLALEASNALWFPFVFEMFDYPMAFVSLHSNTQSCPSCCLSCDLAQPEHLVIKILKTKYTCPLLSKVWRCQEEHPTKCGGLIGKPHCIGSPEEIHVRDGSSSDMSPLKFHICPGGDDLRVKAEKVVSKGSTENK